MPLALSRPTVEVGVVVKDLDAMLRFYRDVVGMALIRTLPVPGTGTIHFMGVDGTSMVKLVQPEQAPDDGFRPGELESVSGYRYWTIHVSNLDELYAACMSGGGTAATELIDVGHGIRYALVRDPEGNIIEFVEIAAAR